MEKHVYLTFKEVYDILHKLMPNNNEHWNTLSNILGIKISKDPFFKLYTLKTQRMNLDAKLPDGFDANLCSENLSKLLGNKKDDDINNAYNSLKALIRNAENVNDAQKQSWLTSKTYPTFEKLFCNVIYKLMQDGKNYHTNEVITYYDQLPKTTKANEDKLDNFFKLLLLISENNYNSIEDADQRFHASSIDIDLLSFGAYVDNNETTRTEMLSTTFIECDNNLIVEGDGGIGKTTFLVNTFKHYKPTHSSARNWEYKTYIPFYISLAALKHLDHDADISTLQHSLILDAITERATTMFQHGLFENLKYDEKVFQKQLREYISNCSNKLKVLLLLDGFNEISLSNGDRLRKKIASNIEYLSTYANVRIIVTSRAIPPAKLLQLKNKLHITATGIPKDKITSILTKNNIINVSDEKLLNILQNPLFLQMFISTYSSATPVANSRGSILYNYYNRPVSENKNYYSETLIHDYINKKLDSTAPSYMPIVMDFILPAIAFQMVMDDTHEISREQCFAIIDDLELLIKPFENNKLKFSHYNKDLDRIGDYLEDNIKSSSILKNIINRVNVLYQSESMSDITYFSFTHHYIRDYFASIFMLNAYLIAPIKLSDYEYYNKLHSFSIDLSFNLLMNEILHAEFAYGDELSLLEYAKLSSTLKDHTLFVNNTLTLLSVYMNRDFSSLHFDGIDLSQYSLYDINCHNSEKQASATFKNCSISLQTVNKAFDDFYRMTREIFLNNKLCHVDFYCSNTLCKLFIKDISTQTIISSYTINLACEYLENMYIQVYNFKISDDGERVSLVCFSKANLHILSVKLEPKLDLLEPAVCYSYSFTKPHNMYRFEYLSSDTGIIMLPGNIIEILDLNKHSVSNTMPCDIELFEEYEESDLDHFRIYKISPMQIVANFSFKEYVEDYHDYVLHEFFYLIDLNKKSITNITSSDFDLMHADDYILPMDITEKGIFVNYKNQMLYYLFSEQKWTTINHHVFDNSDCESCTFECLCNIAEKLYLFSDYSIIIYDICNNTSIHKQHPMFGPFSIVSYNDKYILFDVRNDYLCLFYIYTFEFTRLPRPHIRRHFLLTLTEDHLITVYSNGTIYKLNRDTLTTVDSFTENINTEILQYAYSQNGENIAIIDGDYYSNTDNNLHVYNLTNGIKNIFSAIIPPKSYVCFSKDGSELYILSSSNLCVLEFSANGKNTNISVYDFSPKNFSIKFEYPLGIDHFNPAFFTGIVEENYWELYCFEIIKDGNDYGILYYEIPDANDFIYLPDIVIRKIDRRNILLFSPKNNTYFHSDIPIKTTTVWLTKETLPTEKVVYDIKHIYAQPNAIYDNEYILHPECPKIKFQTNEYNEKMLSFYMGSTPKEIKELAFGHDYYQYMVGGNRYFYGVEKNGNIFICDLITELEITSNISGGINISDCKFINCTFVDDCQEIIKNMNGKIIE